MLKKYALRKNRWFFSFIILAIVSLNSFAFPGDDRVVQNKIDVRLKASHPQDYIVVKGDTLWDIAAKFLQDPWIWPQIWDANPQIKNPHLIYPGDIISLIYIDGKAFLHVERPSDIVDETNDEFADDKAPKEIVVTKKEEDEYKTVKLSPKIRYENQEAPIQAVEASAIQTFLIHPQMFTKEEYEDLPYIIGNYEGRVISGLGDEVYVKGLLDSNEYRYGVYHKGEVLEDPVSQEILGHEAIFVGEVKVKKFGNPSTVFIASSKREILKGDRLVLSDRSNVSHNILPTVSEVEFDGRIIALFNALTQSARNQVVVVNIGKRDGIEIGNVLSIDRFGGTFKDKNDLNKDGDPTMVTIPNVRSGILMIFKVFERVAYGLIMESKRAIHINDAVSTPK